MKRLLLIVLFLAFAGIAFAQENLSVVKLKSGIEIRGEIVELIDGVSVTIKNNDGLFSYNMYEVASINGKSSNTNKTNKNKSTSKTYSTSKSSDNKGYGGIIELYGGLNVLDMSYDMSFSFVNGYHFGPSFYLGVGVGLNIYSCYFSDGYDGYYYDGYYYDGYYYDGYYYESTYSVCCIPIFLYSQYTFMKGRKTRPYVALGLGAQIALTSLGYDHKSYNPHGFYLDPSVGLSVQLKNNKSLNFALTMPMSLVEKIGVGAKVGFAF